MDVSRLALGLVLPLALAAPGLARAQAPTAVVRLGEDVPGWPVHPVLHVGAPGVNAVGDWVAPVSADAFLGQLDHVLGAAHGAAPAVLFTEGAAAGYTQDTYASTRVDELGRVTYLASLYGPGSALQSVWRDGTPLAVQGQPVAALPGRVHGGAFGSLALLEGGAPAFAVTTDAAGAPGWAVLAGDALQPLLTESSMPAGAPGPLSAAPWHLPRAAVSARGSHHLVAVVLATGGGVDETNDELLVLDGAALLLGGGLVREGEPVPAAVGGQPGERWAAFRSLAVDESGAPFFAAELTSPAGSRRAIVDGGAIRWRTGDVVDGVTLAGDIVSAVRSEAGHVAHAWNAGGGPAGAVVLVDDRALLAPGVAVDWDGDGAAEPTSRLVGATWAQRLALGEGPTPTLLARARVDVLGLEREALLALDVPGEWSAFCAGDGTGAPCPCANTGAPGHGCANGHTSGALLEASGVFSASSPSLALHAAGLPPGQPGLFFQGDAAVNAGLGVAFGDGLRCVGGGLVRLQVAFADGAGACSTTADLAARGGVAAGQTKRYQLWYRDPLGGACGSGINLSNAVELAWLP